MNNRLQCCCFFGHRKINKTDKLKKTVMDAVENLIVTKNVDTFLFGSKSQFNDLCYETVTELKNVYPYIKRIYVRAEYPDADESYINYLLERFDYTYFPRKILLAGKAAYVERNYEMIDSSEYCIIYYDENYTPMKRNTSCFKRKSGTKLAFDYAVKKCIIINTKSMLY